MTADLTPSPDKSGEITARVNAPQTDAYAIELPANAHWCGNCEYGIDYDREEYAVACLECSGRGYFVCDDLDCVTHIPEEGVTS